MKPIPIQRNLSHLLLAVLILSFPISCSKDRTGSEEEELPVLGTCQEVNTDGGLTNPKTGQYLYRSSGGLDINIQRGFEMGSMIVTLTYEPFPGQFVTLELWGDGPAPHENLNGKHIKDRIGNSRTIIYPDGTKITFVSTGPTANITAISIYDGAKVHHINISCNKVEYSNSDASLSKLLDDQQADGETSVFEIKDTQFLLYNSYVEDTPGEKVYQRVDLGYIEKDDPKQIYDLYDDPRIDHT